MDFNSDICVFSQKELEIGDYGTGEFIEKHLSRIMEDGAKKKGEFLEYSILKQTLERYLSGNIDFAEFSTAAGNLLHDQISQADEPESMDFLVCQFTEESREYIGLLLLPNKTAYTHQVENGQEGVANKIIRYFTICRWCFATRKELSTATRSWCCLIRFCNVPTVSRHGKRCA